MFHSLTVYGVRRSVIAQQTFDFMDRALTLNNLIYGILTEELTAMRFARYATQEGTGTRSANRVMVGCHYPIIGAALLDIRSRTRGGRWPLEDGPALVFPELLPCRCTQKVNLTVMKVCWDSECFVHGDTHRSFSSFPLGFVNTMLIICKC